MATLDNIHSFRMGLNSAEFAGCQQFEEGRGQLLALNLRSDQTLESLKMLQSLMETPKHLDPRYFYDALGSVLFERICQLSEYYLTRKETEILYRFSPEICSLIGHDCFLIELGSGNSHKTKLLLNGWGRDLHHYVPVDISGPILQKTTCSMLKIFPDLWITALHASYDAAFQAFGQCPREVPTAWLFLGSNIGNFSVGDRKEFFASLGSLLGRDDHFLFGADLMKDIPVMEAAYNDSLGVTAEFNKNVLRRVNRELKASFNLSHFRHRAFFNGEEGRIEMYLESLKTHWVTVNHVPILFQEGETIHTENSYKFTPSGMEQELRQAGLETEAFFTDADRYFGFWVARRRPMGTELH